MNSATPRPAGAVVARRLAASPWRLPTLVLWPASRLALFLYVVLLHHLSDRVFWLYGHRVVALHLVPYRDFPVEYPPLAALLFIVPGGASSYARYAAAFAVIMLLVDLATVLLVKLVAGERDRDAGWRAAFFYTVFGFVNAAVLTKFDALPALLTLLAIALLLRGHERASWVALAAAVLLKGYAIVLAPLLFLYRYNRRGGARWWRGPLAGALTFAVVLLPTYAVAGARFVHSLLYHAQRGLEIESLYASVVLIAHAALGLHVTVTPGAEVTSRDIFSSLNTPLLALVPWALAAGLAATYIVAWRRLRADPSPEALLVLSMAALLAFMIAFKALPSYYLLWLAPLAAISFNAPATRARAAGVTLWLAVLLGAVVPAVWLPLRHLDSRAIAVMAARNLAIVLTFVLLLRGVATRIPGAQGVSGAESSTARPLTHSRRA